MRQFKYEYATLVIVALSGLLWSPYIHLQPYLLWICLVISQLLLPIRQSRTNLLIHFAAMIAVISSIVFWPQSALAAQSGFIVCVCIGLIAWSMYQNTHISPAYSRWKHGAMLCAVAVATIFLIPPFFAEVSYQRAVALLDRQNMAETNMMLAQSIKLNPNIPRYHRALSRAHIIASETLARKAPLDVDQSRLLSSYISSAIGHAKESVRLSPTSPVAWAELGYVYSRLIGPVPDAALWSQAAYERAITLDPNNPDYLLELARVHVAQKNKKDAVSVLQAHVKKFPKDPRSPFLLGQLYSLDNHQEALKWYQKAMTLSPMEDQSSIKQAIEKLQN